MVYKFQIEKMFAGYIGSTNDTVVLQDFFRTLPEIIENRVVQTEWTLVINLSNQIFKVISLYKKSGEQQGYDIIYETNLFVF